LHNFQFLLEFCTNVRYSISIERIKLVRVSWLLYIQVDVDEHPDERGRYIITGSHQLHIRAKVSQSLAGRTALLELLPLSIEELNNAGIAMDRDEYLYTGFLPRIYQGGLDPGMLYRNYYQTYVERDVRQIASIRNLLAFETFLKLLAGRVGQILNLSDLANSTGVSSTTLSEWLSILEASFIVYRLKPYFRNFGKRLIKAPKLHFLEPGLVNYLLGIRDVQQIPTHPLLGGMFENLVVSEAIKACLNARMNPNLYFLRDSKGLECDLLVERENRLMPIEIKASRTFSADFCKKFSAIRKLDPAFETGVIVYGGDRSFEYAACKVIGFADTAQLFGEKTPADQQVIMK
jgi:Predicted ATPase (AAA+ superfamily)